MAKVSKLYGGPSFETGVKRQKSGPAKRQGGMSPKAMASGTKAPNPSMGKIGHKAKGTFVSGTKGSQKGMTSGGKASGRRGAVKA